MLALNSLIFYSSANKKINSIVKILHDHFWQERCFFFFLLQVSDLIPFLVRPKDYFGVELSRILPINLASLHADNIWKVVI